MFNTWGISGSDITKIALKKRFFSSSSFGMCRECGIKNLYFCFTIKLSSKTFYNEFLWCRTVRTLCMLEQWFFDSFLVISYSAHKKHQCYGSLCDHYVLQMPQDTYKTTNEVILNPSPLLLYHFQFHACIWYIPRKSGFVACRILSFLEYYKNTTILQLTLRSSCIENNAGDL